MKAYKTLITQRDGSTFYKNWKLKKSKFFLLETYTNNLNWKMKKQKNLNK